jgi:ATP-binding cassette, subfamily B, bacterial
VVLLKRFLRELTPYLRTLVLIALLTLCVAWLGPQPTVIIKQIFNHLDPNRHEAFSLFGPFTQMGLLGAFLVLLIVSALSGALGFFLGIVISGLGQRFLLDMRRKLVAHLQTLSQGFFEKSQTGKLVSTVVNDVGTVNQLITGSLVTIIQDTATLGYVLVLVFFLNAKLALLALCVAPIYVGNFLLSKKGLADNASKISELRGVIYSDLQEKLAGVQVVKSYAQERSEVRHYVSLNRDNLNLNIKQSRMGTALFARAEFISAIGTAVVLCLGGQMVISGELKPGELVQFLLLVTSSIYAPIVRLIQQNDQFARAQAGLRRIFTLLDTEPAVINDLEAPRLPKIEGRICFDDVWFAYDRLCRRQWLGEDHDDQPALASL